MKDATKTREVDNAIPDTPQNFISIRFNTISRNRLIAAPYMRMSFRFTDDRNRTKT